MKFENVNNFEELKLAKNKFYSEDSELGKLKKELKTAPFEQKKEIGMKIKALMDEGEKYFSEKALEIEQKIVEEKLANEWIDVTKPTRKQGTLHPLTVISNRFIEWFNQNGYYLVKGNEIEQDKYNFEHLNIPKEHPARDMQDSLYIDSETLLRTHNTGFTARELELNANKAFNQYAIGKVYRNDEDDATHSHQFMQVDLVSVGYITFPNLIYTLKSLLSFVLEKEIEIRLRPSYFPFTEPSVEVDIKWGDKWIEVLGAGIVHENVLKKAGYTNDMNAFAAGIGIERIAMIKYGVTNIREFYKNDFRFLWQFKGVN